MCSNYILTHTTTIPHDPCMPGRQIPKMCTMSHADLETMTFMT
jgi:hypothetical protein